MVHNVKDLSADQRLAIESLLGRALRDEESLTIRPARVLKDASSGAERTRLFRQYLDHLDALAGRIVVHGIASNLTYLEEDSLIIRDHFNPSEAVASRDESCKLVAFVGERLIQLRDTVSTLNELCLKRLDVLALLKGLDV